MGTDDLASVKGVQRTPFVQKLGGASRDRTGDLLHAMQALSQLSYSPKPRRRHFPRDGLPCQEKMRFSWAFLPLKQGLSCGEAEAAPAASASPAWRYREPP